MIWPAALRLPDGTTAVFPIDPFAQNCLLQGVDELDYLLDQAKAITAYEILQMRSQV